MKQIKMSFCYKKLFVALLLISVLHSKAQLNGYVFRDYNGNGVVDTSSTYREIGATGVQVKAYNTSDALITTKTITSTGLYSFTSGEIPSGTKVRLEFVIPTVGTNCLSRTLDFSTAMGAASNNSQSSVYFATGGGANVNFAINNPEEYNINTNPRVFVPQYRNGNPLAAPAGVVPPNDSTAFISFNYNASGTTKQSDSLARAKNIGSTFGVAYSKQSGFVFTSAVLKRHTGLGRGTGNYLSAPGSIYLIKPGVDSGKFFTTLDSTLWGTNYYTHNRATSTDPMHVLQNGSGGRGLLSDVYSKQNDARIFDQIGKVGVGGLEIDQNGRYLYIVNIYKNELVRIDLRDSTNPLAPTSTTHLSRWAIPPISATDSTKGRQRPWALKYYRDKLYIGSVLDGATTGLKADMKIYVYEFDIATSTFSTVLTSNLNYPRKSPFLTGTCNTKGGWYTWGNTFLTCNSNLTSVNPQPMFTDIEFDRDGAMVISISDRNGYQGGVGQYGLTGTSVYDSYVNGDILRAYRKNDCTFEMEFNAKEGPSSSKPATGGASLNEGPGSTPTTGGEFYVGDEDADGTTSLYHSECSGGSVAYLPGANHIFTTFIDPIVTGTNGTAKLNNNSGLLEAGQSYQAYITGDYGVAGSILGTHHKVHGLGDLEIAKPVAPIEIGNRAWNDTNYNGIQDADENPLAGINFTLFTDPNGDGDIADGVALDTVTTDASGNYLFSSAAGASTANRGYGLNIRPYTNYVIRVTNATIDTFGIMSVDFITGDGIYSTIKTLSNNTGGGEVDWSDNDGTIFYQSPNTYAHYQYKFTTGKAGESNHTIDFGFTRSFFILNNKEIKLEAKLENENANLNWTCENKSIVKKYILERSLDGTSFVPVKEIENPNQLTYTDMIQSINQKTFFYRIKLVETSDRVLYSNIVKLQKNKYQFAKLLQNPIQNGSIVVEYYSSINDHVKFDLFDVNGRLVNSFYYPIKVGVQNVYKQIPNLQNGTYLMKCTSQYYSTTLKIVAAN